MADEEKLTPEEADVRNQAMLQDLQHMYAPVGENQSLERMRNRLLATNYTSVHTSGQHVRNGRNERFRFMHIMQTSATHSKSWYLNVMAASLVAILLVGSLLLVVTHINQNSNTGGSGPSHLPGAPGKTTPTVAPGSNATPTVAPGSNATPTVAPGSNVTPTVAPGSNVTPTVAPGSNVTPTVAPGSNATPTVAPGRPTPTVAPGRPTPTVAPGRPTPTVAPGSNVTPTVAPAG